MALPSRRVFSRRNLGLAEQPPALALGDAPAGRRVSRVARAPRRRSPRPRRRTPTARPTRRRPAPSAEPAPAPRRARHRVDAAGEALPCGDGDPAAHHLGRRTELAVVVAAPAQQRAGIGHAAAVASPLGRRDRAPSGDGRARGVGSGGHVDLPPRVLPPAVRRAARVDGTRVRRARGGVGVSARASDAATTSRHASRAASPARIAALRRASRCQRGRKRSDRRAAVSCTKT